MYFYRQKSKKDCWVTTFFLYIRVSTSVSQYAALDCAVSNLSSHPPGSWSFFFFGDTVTLRLRELAWSQAWFKCLLPTTLIFS